MDIANFFKLGIKANLHKRYLRCLLVLCCTCFTLHSMDVSAYELYVEDYSEDPGMTSYAPEFLYWDEANEVWNATTFRNDQQKYWSWKQLPRFSTSHLVRMKFDLQYVQLDAISYPEVRFFSGLPVVRDDPANLAGLRFSNYNCCGNPNRFVLSDAIANDREISTQKIQAGVWYTLEITFDTISMTMRGLLTNRATGAVIFSSSDITFADTELEYMGVGYYTAGSRQNPSTLLLDNILIETDSAPVEFDLEMTALSLVDDATAEVVVNVQSDKPVEDVVVRIQGNVCSESTVIAETTVSLNPGENTLTLPVPISENFTDESFILEASVDPDGVIDEVNELNNAVGNIFSIGMADTTRLQIATASGIAPAYCAGRSANFSGVSQYGLVDGSTQALCFEYAVKGGDVLLNLSDGDNTLVASGFDHTDVFGGWSVNLAIPEAAGIYQLDRSITDQTLNDAGAHQVNVVACGGGSDSGSEQSPPPRYTPPAGNGGGSGTPSIGGGVAVEYEHPAGGTVTLIVNPGDPIPAYPGGPGNGGTPTSPGTPIGPGPDATEPFNASILSSGISFSNDNPEPGETITISIVVQANNSYFGLPVSVSALDPTIGSAPIAPTRYYYVNGDLIVEISFTPEVAGDLIIEGLIGPGFSDSDNSDNAATRVLTVGTPPDLEAPTFDLEVLADCLSPPNHRFVAVLEITNIEDNEDFDPQLHFEVSSNQPTQSPGDGNTHPDWKIVQENGVTTLFVRAERSGRLGDRIYDVTFTAVDASANEYTQSASIVVPKKASVCRSKPHKMKHDHLGHKHKHQKSKSHESKGGWWKHFTWWPWER